MDSFNHGLFGFSTHFLVGSTINPTIAIFLGTIGFITGVAPDVIGEYYAHIKKDGYKMYNRCHTGDINKIMKWFPGWFSHTYLDTFGHEKGKRWDAGKWYEYFLPWKWRQRMWIESNLSLVNLIMIFIIKIFCV